MMITQEIHQVLSDYADRYDDLLQKAQSAFFKKEDPYTLGESRSPVQEFINAAGYEEVIGNYRIPDGIEYGEMQDYICVLDQARAAKEVSDGEYMDKIESLWTALADLNPHLEEVAIQSHERNEGKREGIIVYKKRAAIIGIEDGFNIKDINRFLDETVGVQASFNARSKDQAMMKQMHTMVQNRVGERIGWRPSFETLNFIFDTALGRNPSSDAMHPGQTQKNGQDNQPVFKRKTRKDLGM